MEDFIVKHSGVVTGVLSCFDRLVFKGYLPISDPVSMEAWLCSRGILFKVFKSFAQRETQRMRDLGPAFAQREGRPFIYLGSHVRKEDKAREIVERDDVTEGLICVFSVQESTQSFRMRNGEGRPRLTKCYPQCKCLYFYFMDKVFGMMHVRISTWFPFPVQICINGHNWLEKKLTHQKIAFTKADNAFVQIADAGRAQEIANDFTGLNFPRMFNALARKVNPLLKDLLEGMEYYWVIDQAEYATDVLFKDRAALKELYPKLLSHATLCLGAEDVLTFLGRKLTGNFKGEVLNDCKRRWQGARVKHRMKGNWIKMYDKFGCVLRIETVINDPYEFRVRRRGIRKGQSIMGWFPMAKGISNLHRYAKVGLQANQAYLQALAIVENPAEPKKLLAEVCRPGRRNARRRRALNPLSQEELSLFAAAMRGEHLLHGLCNRDLARNLGMDTAKDPAARKRESARVTRLLQLLHAHGLIAKIPRSRRWRVTKRGQQIMGAVLRIHDQAPDTIRKKAA